jgi:hypothetical protein
MITSLTEANSRSTYLYSSEQAIPVCAKMAPFHVRIDQKDQP